MNEAEMVWEVVFLVEQSCEVFKTKGETFAIALDLSSLLSLRLRKILLIVSSIVSV